MIVRFCIGTVPKNCNNEKPKMKRCLQLISSNLSENLKVTLFFNVSFLLFCEKFSVSIKFIEKEQKRLTKFEDIPYQVNELSTG